MVDRDHPDLPVSRQCELLDLPRSTFYHVADPVSDADLEIMALIDRCHLQRPFYGSRRIGFYPVLTDTTKKVHTAPRRSVHDYTQKIQCRV